MMENLNYPRSFGQVSGIEISKGEPGVVKALQKLWQKLQLLEQACHLGKPVTTGERNETTIPELQQRLLELQLQYVRKILSEHNDISTSVACIRTDQSKGFSHNGRIQLSSSHECSGHIPARDCCDKHTQTDSASTKFTNSMNSSDEVSPVGFIKNPRNTHPIIGKNEFLLPAYPELKVASGPAVKPRALNVGLKQRNARTHYHLKLSDVPFIIGTSTSSHSVVANVQKIISMMKVHNKGLCSSVPKHARSRSLDFKKHNADLGHQKTCSSPDLLEHWDFQNRLFSLSDELKALTSKLGNLKHPQDPSSGRFDEYSYADYANILNLIEMKTRQIIALQKAIKKCTSQQFACQQCKSSRSSPCLQCPEKLTPSSGDVSCVNRLSKTEVKHVICSFSDSVAKADCFERRKMVRELKEFQVHLQQEDIHWK